MLSIFTARVFTLRNLQKYSGLHKKYSMAMPLYYTILYYTILLVSVGWKHYLYHRFGNYVIQSILLSNSLDDHQRKNVMHQLLREIDMVELQRQWRDWKRSTLRGPELKRFHNAFLLIRKVCEGDRMMAESMVNLCYAWPEMHPAFIHTLTRP